MRELLHLPIDASAHGPYVDQIIVILHWLMLVLFVGWGTFFVYSLIRFRKKANPRADYVGVKSHASSYIEVGVALFEGVLLVGFAVPVWSNVWLKYPDKKDALEIHVIAEQFAWNVHYAGADGKFGRRDIKLVTAANPIGLDREDPDAKDDIAAINNLHVPVGKPVLIYLTSKDVIHSFGVPLLRVKQDAIPGQQIPITFTATMTIAEIKEQMTKEFSLDQLRLREGQSPVMVATNDYPSKDGSMLLSKGDLITNDVLATLAQAGIARVTATQDTPAEIACAQLCGLGHYRMRGTVYLDTPEQYQQWLEEEAQYLEQ